MAYVTRTLTLIALMCCIAYSNSLKVRSYDRSWTLLDNSSRSLVQGTLFATDHNSYAYASCETTKVNEEKVCNVTQVTQTSEDRSCGGIKIFAEDGYKLFLGGYFQVIPFTDDHIVLAWWDNVNADTDSKQQNLKVGILDMASCKATYLNFPIDKVEYSFLPAVLFYPNHLEVILDSKALCEGLDNCRLIYDLQGKKIGNAKPFLPSILGYSMPVSESSPDKGFFMYVRDLNNMTVMLVNAAGEGKKLLTSEFGSDDLEQRVAFSNAHELYSICRLPEQANVSSTTIYCAQFDANGETRVKTVLALSDNLNWLTVRSLPNGGIIVATSGCDVAQKDCKTFRIWKIGTDVQLKEPIVVEGLELKCQNQSVNLQLRISENKKDEYCFDFGCSETPSDIKFSSKCIAKTDL